jgi:translation elongation factor EF-4
VTAKCYGGDITRKRKLLEKQKEARRDLPPCIPFHATDVRPVVGVVCVVCVVCYTQGKKRMKTIGNVQLSQDAFYSILKKGDE